MQTAQAASVHSRQVRIRELPSGLPTVLKINTHKRQYMSCFIERP